MTNEQLIELVKKMEQEQRELKHKLILLEQSYIQLNLQRLTDNMEFREEIRKLKGKRNK